MHPPARTNRSHTGTPATRRPLLVVTWTTPHDQVCIFIPPHQRIRMSGFLPCFPLNSILSCPNPNLFEHVHFECTCTLRVDIFTITVAWSSQVYCSSGVRLGLLIRLATSLLDRGSPLVRVVRDKTRVCLDIVGWAPRVLKVFGVFLQCDNCYKNWNWHHSRFLVLNSSWFLFFVFESTQLARWVQQKRTQMEVQ